MHGMFDSFWPLMGWYKRLQTARPKACALSVWISKLPRLNREVGLSNAGSFAVHHRVFHSHAGRIGAQAIFEESHCIRNHVVRLGPSRPGISQMRARRMCHD